MEPLDPQKLRDPGFRARYEAKLAEIEEVRSRHTFLDYTTRTTLFDELEAIYRENLVEYELHYQRNRAALDQQVQALAEAGDRLYPYHRAQAAALIAEAEARLEDPAYAVNAQARAVVERLEGLLAAAVQERTACEAALTAWEQRLDALAPEMWADPMNTLRARLAAARQSLQDPQQAPPSQPPAPDEAELTAFCNRKATDLKAFGRARGRWRARVEALRQPGVPRETYLAEYAAWRQQRRRAYVIWAGGVAGVLLIGALAAWQLPGWLAERAEAQAWQAAQTSGSVEGYQAYLDTYPTGPHSESALAAQMRIPEGRLSGYSDPLGRTLDYSGELRNLQPHGQGEATYTDGSQYVGTWRNGLPDSVGTFTAADGTRYTGEWHVGRREGQGTRYFAAGGQYEGQWLEDRYHGQGSLVLPDSSFYVGGWRQGQRHGQGRSRTAAGATYQGGWQEDLFHGRGIYRDSSGVIYDGQWVKGRREGRGVQTWPDGRTFSGGWQQDMRQGPATLTWPDGSSLEAPWARDSIDGWGQFTTRYRDSYTGTWRGSLDRVTLYDGQGNVFKTGRIENGLFLDLPGPGNGQN